MLLDRDADRLAPRGRGGPGPHPPLRVDTVVADLADHEAAVARAGGSPSEHPDHTLLINNAGVALAGRFTDLTLEEFDWVMEINFRAVVTLTHALLPVLPAHPGPTW